MLKPTIMLARQKVRLTTVKSVDYLVFQYLLVISIDQILALKSGKKDV